MLEVLPAKRNKIYKIKDKIYKIKVSLKLVEITIFNDILETVNIKEI